MWVADEIAALGYSSIRFNLADMPAANLEARSDSLRIHGPAEDISVKRSTTVWWYRLGRPTTSGMLEDEARLVSDEAPHVLRGALTAVGVRWVDEPTAVDRAELKLGQLALARRLGIRTPEGVVTSRQDAIETTLARKRVVAKPLSPGEGIAPYVAEVTNDVPSLGEWPVLIQELVAATGDLRIVVIGDQVWAWRREREAATVDWRAVDRAGTSFEAVPNARPVAAEAVRLTKALGLSMSVQDWLDTKEGAVFLEVNPQGAWGFLKGSRGSVAPALARHLVHAAPESTPHWPRVAHRVLADFRSAAKAPANDGVIAPLFDVDSTAAMAAAVPNSLEIAFRANDQAAAAAKSAEEKAGRLVQIGLALLAIALALGSYQLGVAVSTSSWLTWPALFPVVLSVAMLAIATFEALQVDRVGFYEHSNLPAALKGVDPASQSLAAEERGRRLAQWTSRQKHTDLMQARAWFTRGLAALIVAGIVGAVSLGVTSDASSAPLPSSPPSPTSSSLAPQSTNP